jgi:HAMP domain-containing protein
MEKSNAQLLRATDNLGASTQKIKRKPLPDVVPAKRSKDVVYDTRKHTPTASHPCDETCELRRRGTVRVYADLSKRVPADVGAAPSTLDEVERRAREVRRIAMVLEK